MVLLLILEISGDDTWCGVGVGFLRGRVVVLLLVILVLEISGDELWCCCWCWRSQGTICDVGVGVGDLRGRVDVLLLILEISGDDT